jgi:hypothetical protein
MIHKLPTLKEGSSQHLPQLEVTLSLGKVGADFLSFNDDITTSSWISLWYTIQAN